jgi:hypothetical protein
MIITRLHLRDRVLCYIIQDVSKRALQLYSRCYCVASVTKTFTLKGVQTSFKMDSLYAFKYKCFCNIRHTVTFGIQLQSYY